MSVHATSYVWLNSKQSGAKLVVMLALADYASEETGECWPGIEALAKKCRMSTRYLRTILNELERDGEIKRFHGAGVHTKKGSTNRYILTGYQAWFKQVKSIKKPVNGVNNESGHASDGVNSGSARGEQQITDGVNNESGKPLVEPSLNHQKETPAAEEAEDDLLEQYRHIPGIHMVSLHKKREKIKTGSVHAMALTTQKYGSEMVLKAIEIAAMKDKRNWGFVVGVLENWRKDQADRSQPYRTMSPAVPEESPPDVLRGPALDAFIAEARAKMLAGDKAS